MNKDNLHEKLSNLLSLKDFESVDVLEPLTDFLESLNKHLGVQTSISTLMFNEPSPDGENSPTLHSLIINQEFFNINFWEIFSYYMYLFIFKHNDIPVFFTRNNNVDERIIDFFFEIRNAWIDVQKKIHEDKPKLKLN